MSVAVDHSFAVFAGDHALAVHNQEEAGCVPGGGRGPGAPDTTIDDLLDDLPRGRQRNVRTVGSDAELQSTYDALAANATPFERAG